jgi:predicted ATPase/DNA-binding winged helix-turn-helix (wHTH) protein
LGSFQQVTSRPALVLDGCEVDVAQCELVRGGERQHLTTKEVEVLSYLADNPSREVSYEELLERVWGHPRLASTQPVYSVIKRLRRKLDGFGEHRHLVTVHGVGYRFEPPPRAPAMASRPPAPLPAAMRLSSFVGRDAELALLGDVLPDARIVSLVGPGGAGKTRVALELASRAAASGREVALADLSDVVTGSDVGRAIAAAVGARSEHDERPIVSAGRTLRARGTWALILDNAEHLLDAVADAATELTPHLRVIVTSRERLGVPGEHVVEIGPLPEDDAAQLFEERARAAGAKLGDRRLIHPIVTQLDHLPLAIELAAAHAGAVTLERVSADLDRQIDRLRATRRGVPSRHATLRSSVAWSWGLLDPQERAVLAQCVVFAGGFTIEAAEAVVGQGVLGASVQPILVRLSERSLLRTDSATDGGVRLSLYACVRELASEHVPDRRTLEQRHAHWALGAAHAAGALDEGSRPSAYAALVPELENLRAAFVHACAHEHALAAELALAIDFLLSPSLGPGRAVELARAVQFTAGAPAVRLRLAIARSHEDLRFHEDTRSLAHAEGTYLQALEADRLWAAACSALGEPGAALPVLEAAYERAQETAPNSSTLGRLALDLGEAHLMAGRLERAGELAAEAARLLEAQREPTHAARAQCTLSHVYRERGESESALAVLERARRLLEDAGDEVALARLELDRGALLSHVCRTDEAVEALGAAIAAHHRLGLITGEIRARDWMVLAFLGLGRDEAALDEAREIQQLALSLGRPSYEAERAFGATWLVTGRLPEADEAFGRALEILSTGRKEAVRGHVLSLRALGRTLSGRLTEAVEDLEACAAIHLARGSETALASSQAELALLLELEAPRADTEARFTARERGPTSPWERRGGAARRAMLDIVRARRAGASTTALHQSARDVLLEGRDRPSDYFTRCTLCLLDHLAR